ncbi:MAG: SH3 domain-containing protein [Treponema sp.]|jgi:hypothetical protein|nr:SH3 domain-containing protein [Treponema sp.]
MKIKLFVLLFFLSVISIFSQDFPRVKYVNARDGLSQRSLPQLSSDRIGTLLYGERIIVFERSNSITIDGITNYWYKTERRIDGSNRGGFSWVFGGYLSDEMPLDVELVFGYWDTDINNNRYWLFTPYNIFHSATKGGRSFGFYGNWILSGNTLTLNILPVETTNHIGEKTIIIEITVVNKDNLIFTYEDGRNEKLTRSNNIDFNY